MVSNVIIELKYNNYLCIIEIVALIPTVEFYSQLDLLKFNGVRSQLDIITRIKSKVYWKKPSPPLFLSSYQQNPIFSIKSGLKIW